MPLTVQQSGYALTVVRSPHIRRFDIHLLGELPHRGPSGIDLILARASGRLIDQLGGVPAGASGSPVYVDDRLIGAVSTVFAPDYRLIGITPIDAMTALLELATTSSHEVHLAAAGGYAIPVATGFTSQRALGELRKHLGKNVRVGPAMSGRSPRAAVSNLEPGSPLGVAILAGDVSLGSIGTATLVQNKRVLGFGHPAFFTGPVPSALTAPVILAVGEGTAPFKVGQLGPVIGTVVQDRAAGIVGHLGVRPDLVTMELDITDLDLDRQVIIKAQSTPAPPWLSFLPYLAALEGLNRAMDRIGAGSARWNWIIRTAAGAEQSIKGESYDAFDIAGVVANSVTQPLNELLQAGDRVLSLRLTAQVRMAAGI